MKRILISVIAVILVLLTVGGVVIAAGGNLASPFTLIGENAEMKVESPFIYTNFWAGGGKDFVFKGGEVVKLYPGAEVATGEITIQNVSSFAYGVGFYTAPISLNGETWPGLDTVLMNSTAKYYSGQLIMQPGSQVKLGIKVTVPYGAVASSPFKGLKLNIFPTEPLQQAGKG